MAETRIRVVVVTSPAPRQTTEHALVLPNGASVADALRACALDPLDAEFAPGIWGRAAWLDDTLHDGDRIDWCRALRVDPKVARRERFARQGARTAGLFAKPRR